MVDGRMALAGSFRPKRCFARLAQCFAVPGESDGESKERPGGRAHTTLPRGWLLARSLGVLALTFGLCWRGLSKTWHFTIDDAGISYAYAKHWAEGQGLVAVVGGATVEGYSNFSWVALLAAFAALGIDVADAAKWLAAVFTFGTLYVGAVLVTRAFDAEAARVRLKWWELSSASALAVVAMGHSANYLVWMPSGLENPLFAFLLVLAAFLDARESRAPSRWPFSALVCVLLALTRPEGIAYAGVVALAKAWSALRETRFRPQAVRFFAAWMLPLLGYHAWHYATFGEWVPNTYFAKAPGQRDELREGLEYVADGLRESGILVLTPLVLLSWWHRTREAAVLLGLLLGTLAFAVYAGGDWMPRYRFVSFAVPLFACSAALGAALLTRWLGRVRRRMWFPEIAAWVLVAGAGLWMARPARAELNEIEESGWCHFCERLREAKALQGTAARLGVSAATVLTQDFGGPSYESSAQFMPLDLLGLCDRGAALIQQRSRGTYEDYVLERQQYWFHEQGQPPTLLSFPQHFWRSLSGSHELRWAYTEVPPRRLNRKLRSDARLRVSHAAFVDYHPPVAKFEFTELTRRTRLIGAAVAGEVELARRDPNAPMHVVVSLSTRSRKPLGVQLRVKGAGKPTPSRSLHPESRLLDDLRHKPLRFDFELGRKQWARHARRRAQIQIRVDDGHQKSKWRDLLTVDPKVHYELTRVAPRLPRALPPARHPLLEELESRVLQLVERRFTRGDLTLSSTTLGAELMTVGDRFEREGDPRQAYLAYVLAVQADRELSRELARAIHRLRVLDRKPYVLESWLLSQFYETEDPLWQLRLGWHLLQQGRWRQAEYWLVRLDSKTLDDDMRVAHEQLLEALRQGSELSRRKVPNAITGRAPKGVANRFGKGNARGWVLKDFEVDPARKELICSSEGEGTATTQSFVLDGGHLSLFLRGESSAVKVTLRVNGKEVRSRRGSHAHDPTLVTWDVSKWRGKEAKIEVRKLPTRRGRSAAVAEVLLWP